jgi:L-ribulose-5-phosphate 3-epimerase
MQGRLLPKYQGRYQAHPVNYWHEEFSLAKEINLNCIEFILDFNDVQDNPLLRKSGLEQIKLVTEKTGVEVKTICADYLMEAPIHSEDLDLSNYSKMLLITLIKNACFLGVTDIVIPCVDQSSLNNKTSENRFVEMLLPLVSLAEQNCINLSLETDLAPKPFKKLLNRFDSKRITINYDIGNSAAMGFNPIEELDTYGDRITDIHIKDRILGGGPILLGNGSADFDIFFEKLREFNYQGPYIMQAYRDEEGVDIFRKQLDWVKPYLTNA